MIDYKRLIQEINEMIKMAGSARRYAARTHTSAAYICDITAGRQPAHGITLGKLEQLLPDATIFFAGKTNATYMASNNTGGHNSVKIESTTTKIIDKIMRSDTISAETKVEIYNILKDN